MVLHALWAVLRRQEDLTDLRDRIIGPSCQGPAIWVHGASVGELTSVRSLIGALAQHSGQRIIITTTRRTAVTAVRGWQMPDVTVGLAPLDSTWLTRRFLRRNQITRFIVIENELWPARLLTCHAQNLAVVLLSARMSDRSARIWGRFGRLARRVLGPVRWIVPQDAGSARNLVALGAVGERMGAVVKLKAGYVAPRMEPPDGFASWTRSTTFLAAATHPNEENIVLEAYDIAKETHPALRLIIAPRHPERGDKIAAILTDAGRQFSRRSTGDAPDKPIYLADTMGEMALWYDLAGVTFVGGSLVPKGGHTPYEPAAHGSPILHGPNVTNFAEDYATFHAAGAAVEVRDAAGLAAAIMAHLADDAMAAKARQVAAPPDLAALTAAVLQA